ncbi:NAD-dependent epimerase/dehydratase family protein [Corynebacterium poyangense]|uniref:NAD-dependent epimerase/dehydratase family protein n=1 Tax=Corynebacterium poyangense TaxID=2684405 RepID=A0A7H0SKX7_9CORY|nr:NAD(P)-dependent oxidoreductase [Corynebacterium poyangense]QNQ89202.1 NAD-dependent epimerase/dehydratase family protein [Corynebacterium poyangense]
MKIVVTGGSGRVGRYVLARLADQHEVTNADLIPCEVGPENSSPPSVKFVRTDVMDLDSVRRAVTGADAIIHLAAIDFDWNAKPETYITVNTIGTWNVLQAAQEAAIKKVVLCSSVSACGLSEMRPNWRPLSLPVTETHDLSPVQPYSISKQLMENMGKAMATGTDMSVICIRPMAVVLKETLPEFLEFIDDPDTHWLYYYVWAGDLAALFQAAVENTTIKFGIYFGSADDTCRSDPTLDWYKDKIQNKPVIDEKYYDENPRASIFSNHSAKKDLAWSPTTNFINFRTEKERTENE